eukprot:509567-Lingulodinium_polyedra.AAC.1
MNLTVFQDAAHLVTGGGRGDAAEFLHGFRIYRPACLQWSGADRIIDVASAFARPGTQGCYQLPVIVRQA